MNEGLVRRLWLAGGWPPGFPTATDGTPLQVVYPGRRGHGPGPDLRDAIVALPDGRLLKGDVELHNRASEWDAHGHAADERYGRVVLHVVWRDDLGTPVAPAAPGPAPTTIALCEQPERLLFDRLSAAPSDERYHEWLRELPPAERAGMLERLGDERLAAKAARIASDLHALGRDEALHRALLDALGFSQNRRPFGQLAELLPEAALRAAALSSPDEDEAEGSVLALLFLTGGLIAGADGQPGPVVEVNRAPRPARAPGPVMPAGAWELIGVRPANRPHRRLAALARLAVRHRRASLAERVVEATYHPEPRLAVGRLIELVRVGARPAETPARAVVTLRDEALSVGYWCAHHGFGRRLPGGPSALLGEDRARAILANVLLPFALAVADAEGDRRLEAAAWAAWAIAPAGSPNWIIGEMRPLLIGLALTRARREQGAVELYRRCCEERRCVTCPGASIKPQAR
ncbi:MAG TPA: DUF2851 family protein [Chloroflexota bacterium]|jgi:hypothetical protein|nr:DUF2851 family protein [Chloroflexota bacterium]